MKRIVPLLVGLFLVVGFFATPALADVPPLPHAFYGTVEINNRPAPIGTKVEARGSGVVTDIEDNPTITTVVGIYGTSNPFEHRLIVQSDKDNPIEEGASITFCVNGVSTGQTAAWHNGEVTELPLSVTIEEPPEEEPVGDGVGVPTYYLLTNLFGIEARFRIEFDGEILKKIEATSEDGMLTLTIAKGTISLDKYGKRLKSLEAAVDVSPPEPPEDAHIIGLPYVFGPDGATFDPPITFTWSYDPDALPEGVAEEDLVIAYYDATAGKWVELKCVVDAANNKITASVSHFTTFAIVGAAKPAAFTLSSLVISPTEVAPGEKVNVSVSVANTGALEGSYTVVLKVNGVKEAEKSVTVAAGKSQDVSFTVAREDAGSYSVVVDGLSGTFTVVAPPLAPAAFSVSNLSIQPQEVKPKETVTITVSVANTGGTEGSYAVVLKINGVKEAEKSVTVAAGGSETVSFPVTKEEAATYDVAVNGLSGSFTVIAPAVPPKPAINWLLIGGIIGAVVIAGLLVYFLWWRPRG